jgi:ADP-ribosylglycohydrolase
MTEEDHFSIADAVVADRLPAPLFVTPSHALIEFERRQLEDAGRDCAEVDAEFDAVLGLDQEEPDFADRVNGLLDAGPELPIREEYPFDEPSALPAIRERRPDGPRQYDADLSRDAAADAIHGGWLGACAGCLLGKPVQGWSRARIEGFLRDSDQYPLSSYMRADVDDDVAARYDVHDNIEEMDAFVDQVSGMPIDDDIDYIAVGLGVLQSQGFDFEPIDVGNYWLEHLPMFNTYTAERVAYRNLATLVTPPESATHRNPYREMVGALIRADPWGYVSLGDPERAAELAYRDARVSHIKNGIYGEQWVAAMVAAAPFVDGVDELLTVGLSEVPANCRLAREVEVVREWYADGCSVAAATDRIHERWDETSMYDWVHTLSNAQVIAMALLYSDGSFGEALCRAVEAGFDTDSHGATIGSVLGAYHGASGLPSSWTEPLNDSVETSLPGQGRESISGLAAETVDCWARRHTG